MKVLVVGAGPTGLTAAVELARRGIVPTVVDKRDGASTLSRAVGITPRSLELLSEAGVSERLISDGIPMDGLCVYFGDQLALKMPLRSERSGFPSLLCLPQDRTESIMADALTSHGGEVRYGVSLETLSEGAEGVTASFADGSTDTFDHIIGADGIKSTVRQEAGIGYEGIDLPERWSIADVDLHNWRHPGTLTVMQARPGLVAVIVPIGDARYRVVASQEKALEAVPLPIDVTNVRREGSFIISVRIADTYSTGKVHLAGDAAHCHSPVGGRGMNLGIADAAELARRLVDGEMEAYSSCRHDEALSARAVTERARKMSGGGSWVRRAAFRTVLATARSSKSLRRRLGGFIVDF